MLIIILIRNINNCYLNFNGPWTFAHTPSDLPDVAVYEVFTGRIDKSIDFACSHSNQIFRGHPGYPSSKLG